MPRKRQVQRTLTFLGVLVGLCLACLGCRLSVDVRPEGQSVGPPPDAPREMRKVSLPGYVIEPPDILLLETLRALPDRPLTGQRLVRPDGTINLGFYGEIRVAGLTLEQAKAALEEHLAKYIKNPQLNVDVLAYNSKVFYVIADGAGFGQQVIRLPYTGNETVLDAVSQFGGLPQVASAKKMWLARPGPPDKGGDLILPVDWPAISQCGQTATNYQLMPGDRIYIPSDPMLAFDGALAKLLAPFERMFGFTLLGAYTVGILQNPGRAAGGGGGVGAF